MKILKIDHLGIAVNSIDDGKDFWSGVLGLAFRRCGNRCRTKGHHGFFPRG